MKKTFTLLCVLITTVITLKAQINYAFSTATGTFSSITGTSPTLLATTGNSNTDEGYANALAIGFTFTYNGVNYTTFNVSTNGIISFGSGFTASSTFFSNSLSTGQTAARPIVAPLWDDLDLGATTDLQYSVSGTAPNRVLTVQWSNAYWDYLASTPALDFQVKLYETTNVIEFIYNNLGGTVTNGSGGASIGLTAVSTGSGNYMSLNNSGANPTASTTTETSNILAAPASGQIYRFAPVTQAANDATVAGVQTFGTLRRNVSHQIVASIKNLGTSTLNNLPVTLNINPGSVFTNTKTIISLASGASTLVTFDAYTATTVGNYTITVSVPNDDVNGNNTNTVSQTVSATDLNYCYSNAPTTGVGSNTGTIDFAAKFNLTTGSISSISYYFTTSGKSYQAAIWDATGTGGTPGTLVWTSASDTTKVGLVNVQVSPTFNITGPVYIGIRQLTANNVTLGYTTEDPFRTGIFYLNTGSTWGDFAPNNKFLLFIQPTIPSTLPVDFASFKGERKGTENVLSWTTVTEINNAGFELQRSADGINFSTLTFVDSKASGGNSTQALNYSFNDVKPLSGSGYYRLKQVDKDGKSSFSEIVVIKGLKPTKLELVSIYPNPVINTLKVNIAAAKADKVTFVVSDITGKAIITQTMNVISGDNTLQLDVNNLAKGTYTIKAICADGCETAIKQFTK